MSLQKNVVLNITETRLTTAVRFTSTCNPSRRSYQVKVNIVCSVSVRCVLGKYWSLQFEKEKEQKTETNVFQ